MRKYLLLLAAVLTLVIGSAISVHAETCQQTKGTQTTATLSWDAVSGADRYVVTVNGKSATTTGTSYKVTGLKAATKYSATIKVYAGSTYRGSYSLNVYTAPGKLTTVKPTAWKADGTGAYFNMTSDPYNGYLDGYQWKITDRNGNGNKASGTAYSSFTAKLYNNQVYRLRVRGFINVNGKKFYGPWTWKYIVPQPKVNLSLSGSNKIKLSWKKIAGATKYQIYASTSANSGYKRIATVGSGTTSYVVSKVAGKSLVKYQNYYFKVRPLYTKNGKTYKSLTTNSYGGYIYTVYK